MRLGDHGFRRSVTQWRQRVLGQQRNSSQTLYIAATQSVRQDLNVTQRTCDSFTLRYLSGIAVNGVHDAKNEYRCTTIGSRPSASSAGSGFHEPKFTISPHVPPGAESNSGLRNEGTITHAPELLPTAPKSQSAIKASMFAARKRSKEHRLLVNRLLKGKSPLSYDWRIPLRLLEQHYKPLQIQIPDKPRELDRQENKLNDTTLEGQNRDRMVHVRSRDRRNLKLARDLEKPSVWSESKLVEYCEDLVESQYSKDRIPQYLGNPSVGSNNLNDIMIRLDDIFHSSITKRYLNLQVYNIALRFYYAHGIFSKARSLLTQMEDLKIDISTETFNEILKGAASSQDLHNFTFILRKGIQLGFKPDGETWNMLLMTVTSDGVRAVIIQKMRERGVIDALPGNRGLTRLIVQTEVASHIEKHGDRETLLDHLDKTYGITWLTTSTGNKLLDEFSKYASVPETLALLPEMKLRGFVPDEVSLHALLRHCLLQRQHRNAVHTVQFFHYHFGLRPGKMAYEVLFLMAWKGRLLNLVRIVWRYACSNGHLTFRMRNLVLKSLTVKARIEAAGSRAVGFKELVGEFVVSVGKAGSQQAKLPPNLEQNGQSRSTVRIAKAQLGNGIRITEGVAMPQEFGKYLLMALDLDMQWAAAKFPQMATIDQMVQEGIEVMAPVVKDPMTTTFLRGPKHTYGQTYRWSVIRRIGRRRSPKIRNSSPQKIIVPTRRIVSLRVRQVYSLTRWKRVEQVYHAQRRLRTKHYSRWRTQKAHDTPSQTEEALSFIRRCSSQRIRKLPDRSPARSTRQRSADSTVQTSKHNTPSTTRVNSVVKFATREALPTFSGHSFQEKPEPSPIRQSSLNVPTNQKSPIRYKIRKHLAGFIRKPKLMVPRSIQNTVVTGSEKQSTPVAQKSELVVPINTQNTAHQTRKHGAVGTQNLERVDPPTYRNLPPFKIRKEWGSVVRKPKLEISPGEIRGPYHFKTQKIRKLPVRDSTPIFPPNEQSPPPTQGDPSLVPKEKGGMNPLETARLHFSLDQVLDLKYTLDKSRKA